MIYLFNSNFSNVETDGSGGIVYGDQSTLSLSNIEINNVKATINGGAIWIGNVVH